MSPLIGGSIGESKPLGSENPLFWSNSQCGGAVYVMFTAEISDVTQQQNPAAFKVHK